MLPGSITAGGAVEGGGGVLPRADSRRAGEEWLQAGRNARSPAIATAAVWRRRCRTLENRMPQACPIRWPEAATDRQETSSRPGSPAR
jgi:hypothetical protein